MSIVYIYICIVRSAWRDAGVCAPGQRGIGQAVLEASWHSGSALQTKCFICLFRFDNYVDKLCHRYWFINSSMCLYRLMTIYNTDHYEYLDDIQILIHIDRLCFFSWIFVGIARLCFGYPDMIQGGTLPIVHDVNTGIHMVLVSIRYHKTYKEHQSTPRT